LVEKINFHFFRKLSTSIVPKPYHFIYPFSQAIKTRSTTPERAFHELEEYIQKTFKSLSLC
jgi:DNA phosphorothioation-dependent restriction protein DptG